MFRWELVLRRIANVSGEEIGARALVRSIVSEILIYAGVIWVCHVGRDCVRER